MEKTTYRVGDVEVVSIWDDPVEHKKQIEEVIRKKAERHQVSVEELTRQEFKKIDEMSEQLEYRMIGMYGFGGPIFLYEGKSNGSWYKSFKNWISLKLFKG